MTRLREFCSPKEIVEELASVFKTDWRAAFEHCRISNDKGDTISFLRSILQVCAIMFSILRIINENYVDNDATCNLRLFIQSVYCYVVVNTSNVVKHISCKSRASHYKY
jgi:hypothetical protein